MVSQVVTAIHVLCLAGVLVYSLVQLHLSWIHRRSRFVHRDVPPPCDEHNLPFVTIQLPLYNERHVAARLIAQVSRLDYPKNKLEIHVLDDSNDDTLQIVQAALAELTAQGFRVAHIRRLARDGYKAGALRDGLERASGQFVAIFDADFCPAQDMLREAMPYFSGNCSTHR